MASLDNIASEKLQKLASQARKRSLITSERLSDARVIRDGKQLISFSCNDYLGLSHHPQVIESALKATKKYGIGAGASRLVTGNHPLYAELEVKLAKWKGTEAALVFGSGYLANIGVIPAIIGKGDLIIADKLVHACLLDGAHLSGAKLLRFQHNDLADCERLLAQRQEHRNCLIIVDEVFSMDGDVAQLAELSAIANKYDAWLMADGAHSLFANSAEVDIFVGTLSKALGSYGGFVCASKAVIDYIATSARSFIFTTGLPPSVIASASAALDIMVSQPELGKKAIAHANIFTQALGLPEAFSPIVPVIYGDEKLAINAAKMLENEGFLVSAIRPPTVPENTARLRFAFSSAHKKEDILRVANLIK